MLERNDPPAGARHPDRLRDALPRDPGRVDLLGRAAELIALPILMVVLLLVFRSPIAAAIPLGMGAITVFTSRGLLWSSPTGSRSTPWR